MKTVGVVGAGTMGLGIVRVCAENDYNVKGYARNINKIETIAKRLESAWSKSVEKGNITEEKKKSFINNVVLSSDFDTLAACDLIIEAVSEEMELKKSLFTRLDDLCPSETVLATNTSALSITEIAAVTKRPDKVIGLHFFNPVTAMKLVEVVPTAQTSEATVEAMMSFVSSLAKEPVRVRESPGFLVNRILAPYMTEAFFAWQEGLASAEDIDKAMKLGAGMPMGPLELADIVGLDVCLKVSEYLHDEFGDSKYRTANCLKQLVRAGHLGVKTGRGFHKYEK
jgi:3-hydroxybutyryl-CoA dehydrogenase